MALNHQYWAGKRVCVTGGTGFLGWHIVRQVLPLAAHVRVFGLQPSAPSLRAQLQPLDCVYGDVRDPHLTAKALHGCDVVFHTAGTVAMWGPALREMHSIHRDGTIEVLRSLPPDARLVHTSSVVTVGASQDREGVSEGTRYWPAQINVDYVHAKRAAENLALQAADQGKDIVVVNPGYLIGPEDYQRSAMGRFCLRCWKNKVQLIPPGGLNIVDVRDVARGHLLAAQQGSAGTRYILGGENLTYAEIVEHLFAVHRPSARRRFTIPSWLFTAFAWLAELRGRYLNREPYPSIQQVRLCQYHWYHSSARAVRELGYQPRPLDQTLRDTFDWFRNAGLLGSSIARSPSADTARTVAKAA